MNATRALTVAAEVIPERRAQLEDFLAEVAAQLETHPLCSPADFPDTHFTRFVIIDDDDGDGELPPVLVWESNHDRSTSDYLRRVAGAVPDGLDRVFSCCPGYPRAGARDEDAFVRWMRAHRVRSEAFYCAYRGVTREQVVNDYWVRERIRKLLDTERAELVALPPDAIWQRIREHVAADPDLEGSPQPDASLAFTLARVWAIVRALPVLLLALLISPLWYLLLRKAERSENAARYDHPVYDHRALHRFEDRIRQNQLTHLVDIKPGRFRYWTLRAVLFAIDTLARAHYVHGKLGGITSIHFARWVILRDPRTRVASPRHRLLFFSNYDGSWESYLGEFVDRAAEGLTAVWSNTVGFPRTRNLLGEGARDEEAFKNWAREKQRRTHLWWSGVPLSTVQNIRDDVWVRRRLSRRLSPEERSEWLRRL